MPVGVTTVATKVNLVSNSISSLVIPRALVKSLTDNSKFVGNERITIKSFTTVPSKYKVKE